MTFAERSSTHLMTSFSSTDPLPNPEVLRQFFDWLMHKCGGKDVYFNDGSIIKGAFEGFPGGGLEKLEHMLRGAATPHISSIIPIYYIEPLCIESLLPNAVVLQQFLDWLCDLMHKCGGRDVHQNDGSIIRGAFEGFAGGGLEKLNTWNEMYILHHAFSN